MTTIESERDALLDPLRTVASIIRSTSILPILDNVLIRNNDGEISFLANNMEMQIECQSNIEAPDGFGITVEARKLIDILRRLPAGAVKVRIDDGRATITAGRSRYTMKTLPATDYPIIRLEDAPAGRSTVAGGTLALAIRAVHFAAATKDARYVMNCVLLDFTASSVSAVGSDGVQLAMCSAPADGDDMQLTVPRRCAEYIAKALEGGDADALVEKHHSDIATIKIGSMVITTKLVGGTYPPYRRVIPKNNDVIIVANRDELAQAIDRANLMTDKASAGVWLDVGRSMVQIEATNSVQENAAEEVEAETTGSVRIGIKSAQILAALSAHRSPETVKFELAQKGAGIMTFPGDERFMYIFAPMRL